MTESVLDNIPGMNAALFVDVFDASKLTEKEFVRNYVDKNQPCLIKGAVRHWEASKKWTPDHLVRAYGSHQVRCYHHINFSDSDKMKQGVTHIPFGDAISKLVQEPDAVTSIPVVVAGNYAGLAADTGEFGFLKQPANPLFYPKRRVFFHRRASTGWHLHALDETLMCQVLGAKKVALLPTDVSWYKDVKEVFRKDLYMQDKTALDKVKDQLKPLLITVEQGDALYIPPFWWHGVDPEDTDFGATVVFCWRSPWHKVSNFRFPSVREIWLDNIRSPNLMTLALPFMALATAVSWLLLNVRRLFDESS